MADGKPSNSPESGNTVSSTAPTLGGIGTVLGRAAEALADERNLAALRLTAAARTAGATNLPTSAPVSSLLPPVPPPAASAQALQAAQLAVLLNQAVAPPAPPPAAHGFLHAAAPAAFPPHTAAAVAAANILNPLIQRHAAPAVPALPTAAEIQNWSLGQLEKHAELLNKLNQPIPQTLALQLAESRRKEQKKQAKRVANRISASSSRQRKKTMVKEMTEMNTHLKRQALILALLPDLVIVVNRTGLITFCSAQVERVLHHKLEDLEGEPLVDLLVPSSRTKLNNLLKQLLDYEKAATNGLAESGSASIKELSDNLDSAAAKKCKKAKTIDSKDSGTFPLKEVQVKGPGKATVDVNDNSDMSASNPESQKEPSSLTRSPTSSSMEGVNSGSDDKCKDATAHKSASSDNSNTSSLTADANKLQKANANLANNVRWHNKQQKEKNVPPGGYLDDVNGAEVTANNAGARLSSLLQRQEPPVSSGEDSGYRGESTDFREETSSSSDSSESNGRPKPIAPTCNICLIKSDLSMIWCEVTSSIRTLEKKDDEETDEKSKKGSKASGKGNDSNSDPSGAESGSSTSKEEIKEFLLCLRPIRDGEAKVDAKYKFVPRRLRNGTPIVSESSKAPSSGEGSKSASDEEKKRTGSELAHGSPKRSRVEDKNTLDSAAVVESLMRMSNEKGS